MLCRLNGNTAARALRHPLTIAKRTCKMTLATLHPLREEIRWEDVYDKPKPGETEEEWRRRLPNIYSPCKRAGDVVDVPALMRDAAWFAAPYPYGHNNIEEAVMKEAPLHDIHWSPAKVLSRSDDLEEEDEDEL
eukprot:88914_1